MEIEIKNFGPISYLKFDLGKDLHLIYGQNAIGKSYATYSIYCLIKNITNKSLRPEYFFIQNDKPSEFEKMLRAQLKIIKNAKKINITNEVIEFVEKALKKAILEGLQNSLLNTFSSLKNLKNRYSNKNYEIVIHISKNEVIQVLSDNDGAIDIKYLPKQVPFEIVRKSTKSTKFCFYINDKKQIGKPTEDDFVGELVRFSYKFVGDILRKLDFGIRDIYYLPASRSGLYQALNAFTPIVAALTQNRFFMQNKSIELPSLSEPLSDYFIDLSTVDKKHTNKEFDEIIKILQNDILGGEVTYDDKKKRILYKPKNVKLELNLSEASSMVAELSPLVLYFRHIINNKFSSTRGRDFFFFDTYYSTSRKGKKGFDILFIEEPEAHLHPEVQVRLIEIFAMLSRLNIKIFITSHSNYMFNKLNNLLLEGKIEKDSMMVYHLIREDVGTIQNTKMVVSEDGINDDNFQDISEKLYYERLDILDKNNDSKN